jgi:hypothetical protein
MLELTNGQQCPSSFDLFDKKDVAFDPIPTGATLEVVSSDEGVAQWAPGVLVDNVITPAPESPNKGVITTLTDKVGTARLSGTLTLADGTVFTDTIDVTVAHSAAGTAKFTVGTPVNE